MEVVEGMGMLATTGGRDGAGPASGRLDAASQRGRARTGDQGVAATRGRPLSLPAGSWYSPGYDHT